MGTFNFSRAHRGPGVLRTSGGVKRSEPPDADEEPLWKVFVGASGLWGLGSRV